MREMTVLLTHSYFSSRTRTSPFSRWRLLTSRVELADLSCWPLQPSSCPGRHWPARIYPSDDGLSCHVANSVGAAATSVFIRADPKDHSGPGPQRAHQSRFRSRESKLHLPCGSAQGGLGTEWAGQCHHGEDGQATWVPPAQRQGRA